MPATCTVATRPFGPELHNAAVGENLDGWPYSVNAMEIDQLRRADRSAAAVSRLDGLLNRGYWSLRWASSDSHDVARFISSGKVGRTFGATTKSGQYRREGGGDNLVAGRVLVSCGLLVKLTVDDTYLPGDLVPAATESGATITVLGPSWVEARDVALYANGERIREAKISSGRRGGVKWAETWTLPRFKHDVHLAAVATGPGVAELYWPIARPYQPTSTDVNRQVIGATGAVWLDEDSDGKRTSAFEYAKRIVGDGSQGIAVVAKLLAEYDEAVAAQAAGLLARGVSIDTVEVRAAAKAAGPQVERGFQAFFRSWRRGKSQGAR